MPENIKVLTSRRAYEFQVDDLRLSMLITKPIQDHIQQLFQFQATAIGTPTPTFGDVPATIPPGVVFNAGVWITSDEQIVPIRFLHFEQHRIVIDVAGHSSAIDGIFERLSVALSQLQAPDGSPIIGTPERVLNYSEISGEFLFSLDAIIAPSLRKLLQTMIPTQNNEEILIPTVALQPFSSKQKVESVPGPNDPHSFTFTLRAGTLPQNRIHFSGAPLDSERHLAYLTDMEEALIREL